MIRAKVAAVTYQNEAGGYVTGMRFTVLLAAVVAVLVGVVGLAAPVSVSPALVVVECGSALSPDLSAARALDDGDAANTPTAEGVLVDVNYTDLCRMDLEDRRLWTSPVILAGLLTLTVLAVARVRARRSATAPQR